MNHRNEKRLKHLEKTASQLPPSDEVTEIKLDMTAKEAADAYARELKRVNFDPNFRKAVREAAKNMTAEETTRIYAMQ